MPCHMGEDLFLCEPWGDIKACNVLDESMGNVKETDFQTIWSSERAKEVRKMARNCGKECWMIGSVSPEIKKNKWPVVKWILRNKWSY